MPNLIQNSFSRGEIAPELIGRGDTQFYFSGLATAKNVYVHQYGGVSNRAGTRFIAPVKSHDKEVRLIPFVFGDTDTHILEFGDYYLRVIRNDGHVTESPAPSISNVTQTNPIQVTANSHGFSTGDEVYISGLNGMPEIEGRRFLITVIDANTFSLQDQATGANVDGTGFGAYVSGGTAARIYTLASPYSEAELAGLKYSQSFDVLTLVHPSHPRYALRRLAVDNWEFKKLSASPDQQPPTNLALTVNNVGTITKRYAVTVTNEDTLEESLAALNGSVSYTITNITNANPAVITLSSAADLNTGHEIEINGVNGMTEINGRRYIVTRLTSTTFELQGIDSTNFNAYTSGGSAVPAFVSTNTSGSPIDNTISWSPVPGALRYNIYREVDGVFGFLAETTDTKYRDDDNNLSPDVGDSLPYFKDPFFAAGDYPAAVGSHQSRMVYGGSNNSPATNHFSQIEALNNFSKSTPIKDSDAFSTTFVSDKAIKIEHYLSQRDLLVFTNSSIWTLSANGGFTLNNLEQKQSLQIGASSVPPLAFDDVVVFEEVNKNRVFAFRYQFTNDAYVPEDISIFSQHLFRDDEIKEWAKTTYPEPLIFAVTKKGKVICGTFSPDPQIQVRGWARWDTDGAFKSVAAVQPDINTLRLIPYFVVERTINGKKVKYIEKLDSREFGEKVKEAYFVDSGLTYDPKLNIENISSTNPLVITITGHGLSDGDLIDIDNIVWTPTVDKSYNEIYSQELNGIRYKVVNSTADTFQIQRIDGDLSIVDGSNFPQYDSGGTVRRVANKLYGFYHLAGRSVVGLLDGDVVRNMTVNSDGTIDLPRGAGIAHIGLTYISDIETLPAIIPNTVSEGTEKTIQYFHIRLLRSRGLLAGPDKYTLTEWKQREFERYGEPTRLFTGIARINVTSDWVKDGKLFLRQKDPLPMTVLSIIPNVRAT